MKTKQNKNPMDRYLLGYLKNIIGEFYTKPKYTSKMKAKIHTF